MSVCHIISQVIKRSTASACRALCYTVLLTLCAITALSGQSEDNARSKSAFHLKLGGGAGLQTIRDQAMSPLLYDGIQIGTYAGIDVRGVRDLYRMDALFWLGEISSERSGRTSENYTYTINSSYLWRVSPDDARWNWHLGAAVTNWGSFRNHQSLINSNFFYDLFFSTGLTAATERHFRLFRRNWYADWQIIVPALTYGLRPNYSGLDVAPPDDDSFQGFADAQFVSFGRLLNVKSRIELVYPLLNGNRVGLLYYWDFFSTSIGPHPARQSMQSAQLSLHVLLSKR